MNDATENNGTPAVEPPRLKDAALSGPIGEIVTAIAPNTEAAPAGILFSVLSAVGVCIGPTPHQLIDGSHHRLIVNPLLVGPSGDGRKGTATAWAQRVIERFDADFAARNISGGLTTGEGLIFRVRDAAPVQPGETSPDPGVIDKRLLAIVEEAGGTFRKMSGHENILAHTIRQLFDGRTVRTLTRRNAMTASNPHVAIIGGITPDELRSVTSDTDFAGGTVNRFLLVWVERERSLARGRDVDPVLFDRLTARLGRNIVAARTVEAIDMTEGAWTLWEAEYLRLTSGKPGRYGQAVRRAAPYTRRLAALYCLADGRAKITHADLTAGLAAWDYADASARYVLGKGSEFKPNAVLVRNALAAHPAGRSRSQLYEVLGGNHKEALDGALHELREAGVIRSAKIRTGGRSAECWQLTEHALATDSGAGERGNEENDRAVRPAPPFPPSTLSPDEKHDAAA